MELTKRQMEVFLLFTEGHTSKEIADKLFISYRTVEKHVEDILKRFGTKNRVQAVTKAFKIGLMDEPEKFIYPPPSKLKKIVKDGKVRYVEIN